MHVQPRARRNELVLAPSGALKASVTAPPEDGKANAAVIALLSGAWRLPKSAISLKQGAQSRDKVFSVTAEPQTVAARIDAWMKENV